MIVAATATATAAAPALAPTSPPPGLDLDAVQYLKVSWLPGWSSGDAEDATILDLRSPSAPLSAVAATPEGRQVRISVADTRSSSSIRLWSDDRLHATRLDGLQGLIDSVDGVLKLGTPVLAGTPLAKGVIRLELSIDNPWAPTVIDVLPEAAGQVALVERAASLLRQPFG